MPIAEYTERPPHVFAEAFKSSQTPWPVGVDECGEIPGIHLHLPIGICQPVGEGDYLIAVDATAPPHMALTDAEFNAKYVKKTGP